VFFHKIFPWRRLGRAPQLFSSWRRSPDAPPWFQGNKKAPAHGEKGLQNGCALLIFPKPMMLELELAPDIETKVQPVAVVSSGQSLDHSS